MIIAFMCIMEAALLFGYVNGAIDRSLWPIPIVVLLVGGVLMIVESRTVKYMTRWFCEEYERKLKQMAPS